MVGSQCIRAESNGGKGSNILPRRDGTNVYIIEYVKEGGHKILKIFEWGSTFLSKAGCQKLSSFVRGSKKNV